MAGIPCRQVELATEEAVVHATEMNDIGPGGLSANWTIKNVPAATRLAATAAARREGMTVAQWLVRRVAEWEGQEGTAAPALTPTVVPLGDLAHLLTATLAVCAAAAVPLPPQVAHAATAAVEVALAPLGGGRGRSAQLEPG